MTSRSSKPTQFLLHALIPVLCSVVLGFIFFGRDIFNQSYTTSQFVNTPIIASVYYFLLVLGNDRNAYAGLFVLLLLTLFSTHSMTLVFILRDILYVAAIAFAVMVYFKHFRQSARINLFYPAITMSGLYAVTYVIIWEVYLAIVRATDVSAAQEAGTSVVATIAFYGVAIGFAVGGGITVADKILGEMKPVPTDSL